ncbi:MAG: bifunctional diaminohydroxyphosphoribosylaminopyrimidine deaminase/5-amino-6-(5-phosphoribosylamino)uracil reductase RibD [Spirochaetia bacterium]|nr:bifunctional diaminohydroxyphosphoribosylaminopyrimidine deaminase/5-amino-6-(5-phosphoribosylamino)uracil reductase RibD [Spirochaetia bacterium]
MFTHQDQLFLSAADSLLKLGGSAVRPNPKVGAVLVREAEIVAEGYHARYGGPHAEALALERAGELARGSTLYCTLEPCSFTAPDKHNEPCTAKIIRADVSRVVIGQLDPNSRVRGRGVEQLRRAGIEVEIAADEELSRSLWYQNARFNTAHALKRPFVRLKLAQSLDGKIATGQGDSKWITDAQARSEVHHLRSDHDAVLVGAGTVHADDPLLNVRLARKDDAVNSKQPKAVVLDALARTPLTSKLVQLRAEDLILCVADETALASLSYAESAAFHKRVDKLTAAGVHIRRVPAANKRQLSLIHVLDELYQLKIQSVMVEGGAQVITSFINAGLWDAMNLYIAPILIGGDGRGLGTLHTERISEAVQLERVETRSIGPQAVISGFRSGWFESVSRSVKEELHVYGTR